MNTCKMKTTSTCRMPDDTIKSDALEKLFFTSVKQMFIKSTPKKNMKF
jgi:hypothetical protein